MKTVSKYDLQRCLKYATKDNQEIKRHFDTLNLHL